VTAAYRLQLGPSLDFAQARALVPYLRDLGITHLYLSPVLQANGYSINQFALDAIPYVLTLVVLVLLGKRRAADAPEELQKVFEASVR